MSITPPPQPRTPVPPPRREPDSGDRSSSSASRPQQPHDTRRSNAAAQGAVPERIGPYRILREIGVGGMGTVYLGEDDAGTRLAIKIPFDECVADELSVKRFYREARSAGRVEHPNLCPVRDVGQDGPRFYLAMNWIDGETLAHRLKAGQAPTPARALQLVTTLADALQAAHDAGIIHRDLKPSNIMLRPDGQPVIIDFGTARRFDNAETLLTLTGSIVGTPGYMAPEQITAEAGEIGPACDIYALGVVLYEMLAGHPPFSGNFATILGSIVAELPPPLTTNHPDIEPVLESICLRALEKDPAQRYETAEQFGRIVAEYLRDGPQAAAATLAATTQATQPTVPPPTEADSTGLLAHIRSLLFGKR